jgi:hypothetical protein
MVSYQVHRSADYLDYRKFKLKDTQKKKSVLLKRLENLSGKT